MAFSKKTWQDRVSEQPQRRLLTPTGGGTAMTVDVTRQEGIVVQEGDAFSAANMNDLETRIKNTFDADEATLNTVNNKANTNASNIATLQTNVTSVSNRVTSNTNKINTIENELIANNNRIYMDYKNGKYGINTSANRGADTFIPFNQFIVGDAIAQYVPNTQVIGVTAQYKKFFILTFGLNTTASEENLPTCTLSSGTGTVRALVRSNFTRSNTSVMGCFYIESDIGSTYTVGINGNHDLSRCWVVPILE